MRSPIKWAGGKSWIVPLVQHVWETNAYDAIVEPFAGAASVSFQIEPQLAVLNDMCWPLINFYQVIRSGTNPATLIPFDASEAWYIDARSRYNTIMHEVIQSFALPAAVQRNDAAHIHKLRCEMAALFLYLNRTGYNGLYRVNQRGAFNVPWGNRTPVYTFGFDDESFNDMQRMMRGWALTSDDACNAINHVSLNPSRLLVFADPPYDDGFVSYTQAGFSWEDQVRTAKWLSTLDSAVIATNSPTPRVLTLYHDLGFDLFRSDVTRLIAANGTRPRVSELVAVRNVDPALIRRVNNE